MGLWKDKEPEKGLLLGTENWMEQVRVTYMNQLPKRCSHPLNRGQQALLRAGGRLGTGRHSLSLHTNGSFLLRMSICGRQPPQIVTDNLPVAKKVKCHPGLGCSIGML